jgi:hypothetical protein
VTAVLSVRIVSNAGNLRTPTNLRFQNLSVICDYLIGVNYPVFRARSGRGLPADARLALSTRDAEQLCSSRELSHAVFSSQELRTSPRPNGNDRKLIDLC